MSLKKKSVLFLDLQTTGAKPGSAHILEAAWTSSLGEETQSFLVAQPPETPIPRRIQFITGIFEKDLAQAQPLEDVFTRLEQFTAQHVGEEPLAVIHFAQFEKPFLAEAYSRLQKDMPFEILCTHEIAKRLLPNLPTRGIKGLAGYFGCPSGEFKRAAGHVQATQVIWQGLVSLLEEKGLTSLQELKMWLQETPKTTRTKYEYPLAKEKRLSLPKQPGIYRMLSRWGEVLYVGKATSLHDRVNSYFRGQKNRDARKLEMLTQVWDLDVTPVGSPLEAALLETDEIKRLNPPYNVSLKVGRRELAFFNRDFTSFSARVDEEHCVGPFSSQLTLDSMLRLSRSLQEESFDENMFFEPLDKSLLQEGFALFCEKHGFRPEIFRSMRTILAVGLNWYRQLVEENEELEEELLEEEAASLSPEPTEDVEVEVELTAADIADKFERHFIRSGAVYWRARKLTHLLNADIEIQTKKPMKLSTRQGQVLAAGMAKPPSAVSVWESQAIDTYDRMTVLFSELNKIRASCEVKVTRIIADSRVQKETETLI